MPKIYVSRYARRYIDVRWRGCRAVLRVCRKYDIDVGEDEKCFVRTVAEVNSSIVYNLFRLFNGTLNLILTPYSVVVILHEFSALEREWDVLYWVFTHFEKTTIRSLQRLLSWMIEVMHDFGSYSAIEYMDGELLIVSFPSPSSDVYRKYVRPALEKGESLL